MPIPRRAATPSLLQIDAILMRLTGASALAEVLRFLRSEFPHFAWIGVYRVDGPLLRLAAWQGDAPTEHETIPVGRGVCGRAVREGRTVLVGDVSADPDYLACFLETKAELVVPIRSHDSIVGEIDVDGTTLHAFDATDADLLERVATKIAAATVAASTTGPPP